MISSWSQDDHIVAKEAEAGAATDKSSPEDLLSPIVMNGEAHQALDGDASGRNMRGWAERQRLNCMALSPAM